MILNSRKTIRFGGRWLGLLLIAAATALCAGHLFAQSDNGSIVGTVTDPTGAAIPGAAITVTNSGTGQQFHATSDNAGEFSIFAVARGDYKADVAAKGFQTQSVNFSVDVATAQTLIFKLTPGEVSTTVE